MDPVRCDNCGHDVPAREWCVRCGTSLAEEKGRARGFAAAPGERLGNPAVVSTIFPQLPNDSMAVFRGALGVGMVVVVALAAAGLFPVALVAAAVLVPLVTVIYFYDVDVYEDQPVYVIGLTMVAGAVGGALVAVLVRTVAPADATFAFDPATSDELVRGIVVPLVSAVVILLPTLVLLGNEKFNDVLDGSTFGAAAAISFTGAQVIVQSLDYLEGGVSADGDFVSWTLRLLTIAIASPVVTAAAMGAAAAALWLRYRAPVADRHQLGALGKPPVALPLAALVLVVAGLVQVYLPTGAALAVLLLLAAAALIWLRRVIHLGLLQEAAEIAVGPEITCANCGQQTAQHTFCSECGVSLRALPKSAPPAPSPEGPK